MKKVLTICLTVLLVCSVVWISGCEKKVDHSGHDHSESDHPAGKTCCGEDPSKCCGADKAVEAIGEQTLCPVMGNPINKEVFIEYKGKKVYFCCSGCDEKFTKAPEKYLPKLPQFKNNSE